ncbi:MAG: 50S ribosomal protein L11 methyltransferase, partial [Eubacteriaceae bacterium]|nr:50S ribosomal protein L11 methyltransferase [Eubacteriaceae bacterium]
GTHETTSLCVKMLEKYQKAGDKVLDVGCGSGILSIAAALLGAKDVLGIDIDPVAVEVAEENIQLNKADNVARAQYGDLTKGVDYKAQVVVANLMADLVMMLADDVSKHMEEKGFFISSGILVEKRNTVSEHLVKLGFDIVEIVEDGGWCAIVATI